MSTLKVPALLPESGFLRPSTLIVILVVEAVVAQIFRTSSWLKNGKLNEGSLEGFVKSLIPVTLTLTVGLIDLKK